MAEEYAKGRDFISATKVNYAHYILKHLLGFTIHPVIKSSFAQSASQVRIADFGTQTAIWVLDVAEDKSLGAVEVHGFDISTTFFPTEAWWPANVRLSKHDVYQPFAPELGQTFDVVHIRFFLTMTEEQVQTLLKNAMRILKPGGFIQWTEHDKPNIEPVAQPGSPHIDVIKEFIKLEMNPFPGYNAMWVDNLASGFSTAGLEVVAEDRAQTKPSFLAQFNALHSLSIADVPVGLSTAIDDFRDKYSEKLNQAYAGGAATIDTFLTVVGRKPN